MNFSQIACILLVAAPLVSRAGTPDTAAAPAPFRHELQLTAGIQRLGTYQDLTAAGLWYGKTTNGRRFRLGVAYFRLHEWGTPQFRPAGPDSIRTTRQYATANLFGVGAAQEREHPVVGRLACYAGFEARVAYGSGRLDSTAIVERAPVGLQSWGAPETAAAGIPFRAAVGQVRGYIGLRSTLQRVTAGVDVGGFLNALGRSYGESGSMTDLTLGTDFRFAVGYRF